MRLADVVATSDGVQATPKRKQKIGLLAECLRRAAADDALSSGGEGVDAPLALAYLCGEPRQGKLGIGVSTLRASRPGTSAARANLSLRDVDAELQAIQDQSGPGSKSEKQRRLHSLMSRATSDEQAFLFRLLTGELRQGALEAVLIEAVAEASGTEGAALRRALMLAGDLRSVAAAVLAEGASGLSRFRLEVFRPLRPMLAQTVDTPELALSSLAAPCFEVKLDGARVQLHKQGDEVRLYSRNLNDVTPSIPELAEAGRALPVDSVILDGEAIARGVDGRTLPFQTTMQRFGRKLDVARQRARLPLSGFAFDALHLDGSDLVDRPYSERQRHLDELLGAVDPEAAAWLPVERLVNASAEAVASFLERALDQGYEGLMAKDLGATYQAGRRGAAWLKLKPTHTLDLVVLAAEWGSGRRRGFLSNLHLGARDPEHGGFVMLGKTFKGLTDELLRDQTRELLVREVGREGQTVHVRPELVVEVAFDGLQRSPKYPGGLALRFARVRRYRGDKRAEQADTIDAVRRLHLQGHRR